MLYGITFCMIPFVGGHAAAGRRAWLGHPFRGGCRTTSKRSPQVGET